MNAVIATFKTIITSFTQAVKPKKKIMMYLDSGTQQTCSEIENAIW